MDYNEMKEKVQEQVEAHRHDLIDLSLKIHANPELGWEEEKASN
jgi:metal-dependent amidase/aminoacylase/carboxypeptidase family protein